MTGLGRDLASIENQTFDLAVIGGGITGAGVVRHAALAGLSTLLVEASDFASGTSSRSTKLIHGGLRYLAMGDFALVREGALERKSLKQMAPHLTQPQWMVVPAASRLAMAKLQVGISLYEMLGAVDRSERHQNWSVAEIASHEPLLNRSRFPYACTYREYLTDDARLVLATLRGAAAAGAVALNHVRLEDFEMDESGVELNLADMLGGQRLRARASVLVNAAGPWVENVLGMLGSNADAPQKKPKLHLSKGVHIALPRERLPIRNMVMMTTRDGRPVFAIPRGQVIYVGTTDTTYRGGPGYWPEVTAEDVDYLLEPVNDHFREVNMVAGDVVGSWAGLRPLVREEGKAPKEMSRRDEIWQEPERFISIAGGKLTGYRKMAEQVLERVGKVLKRDVSLEDPLATLPGGDVSDVNSLVAEIGARYGQSERVALRLVRLYGSEAATVLGESPQQIAGGVFAEEVRWAVQQESARTLEDVVYRRLRVPWFRPGESQSVALAAADIMAEMLGWDGQTTDTELRTVRDRLREDLHFPAA
ncbi:MAG: glycerol-3-phosphate dehydrogenase/oxidase [Gammaproteobacteria bacterium]|jgi:glycerol-3-phosphate dehydrogenase|nr:MAG: glycerol-3-phosphate dehydrogenase/oxidase [Gammaproteobacteria bacterium]